MRDEEYSRNDCTLETGNKLEIPLENFELCNLSETVPTQCPNVATWYKACEYATFYSSTCSLLPTHWDNTNQIVARNRRIGVGIIDYTGWIKRDGLHKVTKYLRHGYKIVRATNIWANGQAGIPEAIRVTTVKPGGTTPKLPGKTSGAGYPTFEYMIRRMRVATNNPVVKIFQDANIPWEPEKFDKNTLVFSFPVASEGSKPAEKASLWEQANNLVTLQREWADNSVSNTLYFKPKWTLLVDLTTKESISAELSREEYEIDVIDNIPKISKSGQFKFEIYNDAQGEQCRLKVFKFNPNHEEDDIEPVLASIVPVIKACSLLPHTPQGVYEQMPEEGITKEQYENLRSQIIPIDWSGFTGSDGMDEKYCNGPTCEIPNERGVAH